VISPGPGHPSEAGRSLEVISEEGYGRPVLGVCLGHQAIAHVHGASVVRAEKVVHGKVCPIEHRGGGLFRGVPREFSATRYHSLVVSKDAFPSDLEVLAESPSGEVMALRVRDRPVYGLQFHPESVMTSHGKAVLGNFLGMCSR
jgi:anthranilate synthase/aminodeoxychorismate synthase-like glutamine amidotransferase